jgi:hypothetical protein
MHTTIHYIRVLNIKVLVLAFIYSFGSCDSLAQQFFVSSLGSDTNNGSYNAPFASIDGAKTVIRGILTNMNQNIIVNIADGLYPINQTISFTSADSGRNGYRVIYKASNTGKVKIQGGINISNWVLFDGSKNIYKAQLATGLQVRNFFVNNIRAQRARSLGSMGFIANTASKSYKISPNTIQNWSNVNDIEVAVRDEWKHFRIPISTVNDTLAIVEPNYINTNIYAGFSAKAPVFIENAFELLDEDGEWYYRITTGEIFYKPRVGENINNVPTSLAILDRLIDMNNTRNIVLDGLAFEGSTRTKTNTHGLMCGQGDQMMDFTHITGALQLNYCNNILIKSCAFKMLGTSGIRMNNGCSNNVVFNSVFEDISGSAVSIGVASYSNISSITPLNSLDNNWVYNNTINNIGVEYEGCPGIMLGNATRFYIAHNTLTNMPYSGISLGWGWSKDIKVSENCVIAYNKVHNTMSVLNDGGGIYTVSSNPGLYVMNNYVKGSQYSLYGDGGSSNINWFNNVIQSPSELWMFLWESSGMINNTISGNFTEINDRTVAGTNTTFTNNIVVADGKWPPKANTIMNMSGVVPNAIGDISTSTDSTARIFWGKDPSGQTSDSRLWASFGNFIVALDNLNGIYNISVPIATAGTIAFHKYDWYVSNGTFWYRLNNPMITADEMISSNNVQPGKIVAYKGHIWGFDGSKWSQLDELIGTPTIYNTVKPVISTTPYIFLPNATGVVFSCSSGDWSGLIKPIYSFQWQLNGVNISGAVNKTYTPSNAISGVYTCIVTALDGLNNYAVASNTYTVSSNPPTVSTLPVIINKSGILEISSNGAWGSLGLFEFQYQWQKNGLDILGAVTTSYAVPTLDYNNSFSCKLTVSNNRGESSAISNSVNVNYVLANLTISNTVAFSLRKLSSFVSNAIQVRRTTDNALSNIGFDTYGNLDTLSLKNFVGSSNGYVRTWYDQSGNSRNAIQLDTVQQPIIVSNGSIIRQNGRPTLNGGTRNTGLIISGQPSTQAYTAIAVFKKVTSNNDFNGFSNTSNQQLLRISSDERPYTYYGSIQGLSDIKISSHENLAVVSFERYSGTSSTLVIPYRNSKAVSSHTSSNQSVNLNKLGSPWSSSWGGWYSEAIWLNSIISSNEKRAIENNQMYFYNILY